MILFEFISTLINELVIIFKSIFEIIKNFFKNIIPIIKKNLIKIIDNLFNGDWFKIYISILLIFFLACYYYIIYVYNLFNLNNNKFSYILSIIILTISLTIYYLLIHRNQYKENYDTDYYNKESNKIYEINDKNYYNFNIKKIQKTLFNPILNSLKYLFSYILIFLIPIFILVFIFYILQNFKNSFIILQIILNLIIFIIILAIIAKLLKLDNSSEDICNTFEKTKKDDANYNFLSIFFNKITLFICIIKNFIFFIPCLLIIYIEKLKEDLKLTHSTIFILLLLEILLITSIFFIPILYTFILKFNGNDLLQNQGPYYLNEYKVIGTYQELYGQYNNNKNNDTSYHNFTLPFSDEKYNFKTIFNGGPYKTKIGDYSYSISFYLYLNPQPENTSISYNQETTLFNYSDKPRILYNGKTKQIIIKSKALHNENDQSDIIFISDSKKYNNYNLKYQKWLHFIINYDKNIIDIFIDGKLITSKKHVPDFHGNEKISIGDIKNKINKNGIHGGIKDIYYFSQPQQPNNIEFLYNLTKNN